MINKILVFIIDHKFFYNTIGQTKIFKKMVYKRAKKLLIKIFNG